MRMPRLASGCGQSSAAASRTARASPEPPAPAENRCGKRGLKAAPASTPQRGKFRPQRSSRPCCSVQKEHSRSRKLTARRGGRGQERGAERQGFPGFRGWSERAELQRAFMSVRGSSSRSRAASDAPPACPNIGHSLSLAEWPSLPHFMHCTVRICRRSGGKTWARMSESNPDLSSGWLASTSAAAKNKSREGARRFAARLLSERLRGGERRLAPVLRRRARELREIVGRRLAAAVDVLLELVRRLRNM